MAQHEFTAAWWTFGPIAKQITFSKCYAWNYILMMKYKTKRAKQHRFNICTTLNYTRYEWLLVSVSHLIAMQLNFGK